MENEYYSELFRGVRTRYTRRTATLLKAGSTANCEKLRPSLQIKGFRPGKVPLGMIKKLHGRAVAYEVVDELIQEVYKAEVLDAPETRRTRVSYG